MSTETQCLLITKTFSLKGRDSLEHWLNVFGAWGPNRVKDTNIPDFLLSWLSLIIIKLLKKYHVESQRRPICRCTTEHKCSHSAGLFDYGSSGSFWRHGVGGSSSIYRPWEAIDPGKPQRKPLSLQWPKKKPSCWAIPLYSDARGCLLGAQVLYEKAHDSFRPMSVLCLLTDETVEPHLLEQVVFWTVLKTRASHGREEMFPHSGRITCWHPETPISLTHSVGNALNWSFVKHLISLFCSVISST